MITFSLFLKNFFISLFMKIYQFYYQLFIVWIISNLSDKTFLSVYQKHTVFRKLYNLTCWKQTGQVCWPCPSLNHCYKTGGQYFYQFQSLDCGYTGDMKGWALQIDPSTYSIVFSLLLILSIPLCWTAKLQVMSVNQHQLLKGGGATHAQLASF